MKGQKNLITENIDDDDDPKYQKQYSRIIRQSNHFVCDTESSNYLNVPKNKTGPAPKNRSFKKSSTLREAPKLSLSQPPRKKKNEDPITPRNRQQEDPNKKWYDTKDKKQKNKKLNQKNDDEVLLESASSFDRSCSNEDSHQKVDLKPLYSAIDMQKREIQGLTQEIKRYEPFSFILQKACLIASMNGKNNDNKKWDEMQHIDQDLIIQAMQDLIGVHNQHNLNLIEASPLLKPGSQPGADGGNLEQISKHTKQMRLDVARVTENLQSQKQIQMDQYFELKKASEKMSKVIDKLEGHICELQARASREEQDINLNKERILQLNNDTSKKSDIQNVTAQIKELEVKFQDKLRNYLLTKTHSEDQIVLEESILNVKNLARDVQKKGEQLVEKVQAKIYYDIEKLRKTVVPLAAYKTDSLQNQENFEKFDSICESQGIDIRQIKKALQSKSERQIVEELHERVQHLPHKSEVEKITIVVSETLAKYESQFKCMEAEFEKQIQIILRYDEVISDKASKITVKEQGNAMDKKFVEFQLQLRKELDGSLKVGQECKELMQKSEAQIQERAMGKVQNYINEMRKTFLTEVTIKDLSIQEFIKTSCNSLYETRILNNFANTSQFDSLAKNLSRFYEQFRNALQLQYQSLQMNLTQANETQQSRQNKFQSLCNQSHALNHCITNNNILQEFNQITQSSAPLSPTIKTNFMNSTMGSSSSQFKNVQKSTKQIIQTHQQQRSIKHNTQKHMSVRRMNGQNRDESSRERSKSTDRLSNNPNSPQQTKQTLLQKHQTMTESFYDQMPEFHGSKISENPICNNSQSQRQMIRKSQFQYSRNNLIKEQVKQQNTGKTDHSSDIEVNISRRKKSDNKTPNSPFQNQQQQPPLNIHQLATSNDNIELRQSHGNGAFPMSHKARLAQKSFNRVSKTYQNPQDRSLQNKLKSPTNKNNQARLNTHESPTSIFNKHQKTDQAFQTLENSMLMSSTQGGFQLLSSNKQLITTQKSNSPHRLRANSQYGKMLKTQQSFESSMIKNMDSKNNVIAQSIEIEQLGLEKDFVNSFASSKNGLQDYQESASLIVSGGAVNLVDSLQLQSPYKPKDKKQSNFMQQKHSPQIMKGRTPKSSSKNVGVVVGQVDKKDSKNDLNQIHHNKETTPLVPLTATQLKTKTLLDQPIDRQSQGKLSAKNSGKVSRKTSNMETNQNLDELGINPDQSQLQNQNDQNEQTQLSQFAQKARRNVLINNAQNQNTTTNNNVLNLPYAPNRQSNRSAQTLRLDEQNKSTHAPISQQNSVSQDDILDENQYDQFQVCRNLIISDVDSEKEKDESKSCHTAARH